MKVHWLEFVLYGAVLFWIGMFWEYHTHKKEEEKGNAGKETCIICQEQHKTHAAILEKLKKQSKEENNHER